MLWYWGYLADWGVLLAFSCEYEIFFRRFFLVFFFWFIVGFCDRLVGLDFFCFIVFFAVCFVFVLFFFVVGV